MTSQAYISQIYSKSLYQVVGDSLEDEAKAMLKLFKDNDFFFNVRLNNATKFMILKDLKTSAEILNLGGLLLQNNRSKLFSSVLLKYIELVKDSRGEVDVEVTSCISLNQSDKDEILCIVMHYNESALSANVSNVIDKKILGGFIIRVNFEIIDFSMLAKLNRLKESSLEALLLVK